MTITEKEMARRKAMSERNTKHGMARCPEYLSWVSMIQRCHNEQATGYHNYGGRGICVCPAWRSSFKAFFRDMGSRPSPQHTLDRINNDGNYDPGNCRWATASEQKRNSRAAKLLTHNGQTKTIVAWAEDLGVSRFLIRKRIAAGWSAEDALTKPSHRGISCKQK